MFLKVVHHVGVNRYIFYNCDLIICSYFRPIKSGGLFNVCLLERFKYTLSDLLRLLNSTVIGISSRGQCLGFLSQFLGRQNVSYPCAGYLTFPNKSWLSIKFLGL